MTLLIKVGIFVLNIIFYFLKKLPVEKKILYISRQSNRIPVDFSMIKNTMEIMAPDYRHVMLIRTIDPGLTAKIQYCFHMLLQMYHLATAHIVILDSYCITVSVLKQRESLLVIQIWHALGALKKFGYSILDKEEGSSARIAGLMKMHNNYSYVFTSGEACRKYFSEAFHQSVDTVKVFPLPRLDLLLDKEKRDRTKSRIIIKYPFLFKDRKKIIVYAPTFRKDTELFKKGTEQLFRTVDYDRYHLIYKPHPLSEDEENTYKHIIYDSSFTTEDMLYIADYVITDYSAIIFEAMVLKKQIVLYAFDFESYTQKRDFYLDYLKVFSGYIAKTPDQVMTLLEQQNINDPEWDLRINELIASPLVSYTEDICEFLIKVDNTK